ncbi:MAG: AAC(3) family N-acetyltransferase [Anaerolineae bacterium]|nr:AAC(3) family N-acetyltransferase [Anaerolineae bacterium]
MGQPLTISSLVEQMSALGIESGMTLVVHSSLSSLGYVVGGAPAVILALESVLGPEGTLAMPTHSGDLTDPAGWSNPPVPEAWHELIRVTMPAFHPDLTPTRGMGVIPECFRKQNGTRRSCHPFVSWAARGPHAAFIASDHALSMSQGERSPLARLYERDAYVLLLGVGYDCNTSFHLAEYRCQFAPLKRCTRGAPMPTADGGSRWTTYDDIFWYDADFGEIGRAFEDMGAVRVGNIGQATSRLFSQPALVDFAVRWMDENRRLPD